MKSINTIKELKTSGIYKIIEINSYKTYIGQSSNMYIRYLEHIRLLRKNKHTNSHLQNAWNKYGENSFIFLIVENCEKEKLNERELYQSSLIEKSKLYNLMKCGGAEVFNTENQKYIKKIRKNRIVSEETRKKLSESHKGIIKTKEWRENLSKANTGKKTSYETREKNRQNRLKEWKIRKENGWKMSEETKKKMSLAKKGWKQTPEQIEANRQRAIKQWQKKRELKDAQPIADGMRNETKQLPNQSVPQ
jgi:group I intron endonuclease